jgi:hypothetical protein
MKRPDDNENTLKALRELPPEVHLDQVQHFVATFPIAVGITAWLAALKFHLNSIIMTTTGTIIIGTGAYLFNVAAPAAKPEIARRIEPAVVIEMPAAEMLEEPAVVLETPVQKKEERPAQDPPPQACMVWPGDDTTAWTSVTTVHTVTTYEGAAPYPGATAHPGVPAAPPTPAMEPRAAVQAMPAVVYHPSNERSFDLRGFSGVALRGSMNVALKQGAFAVTATGDQALLERLRATVENGVLRLEFEKDKGAIRENWTGAVNVAVSMPTLRDLAVHGSGTIASERFDRAEELVLKVLGSGDIFLDGVAEVSALNILLEGSGDIRCGEAKVLGSTRINLTGSGDVKVVGSTASIDVDIVGSGDVAAAELKSGGGKVHIMGSGDAFVNSDGKLDLKVTGSGTIHTSGSAGLKGSRGVGTGTE